MNLGFFRIFLVVNKSKEGSFLTKIEPHILIKNNVHGKKYKFSRPLSAHNSASSTIMFKFGRP